MKCPVCGVDNDCVLDSRLTIEGDAIRRRRKCLECGARYTTHERIELTLPRVIKRDGRREDFDRAKIERGLHSACQKRKIPSKDLTALVDRIVHDLEHMSVPEVHSEAIGELIMKYLRDLDTVAYVRFASVYSAFDDVQQFIEAVRDVAAKPMRGTGNRTKSAKAKKTLPKPKKVKPEEAK